MRKLLMFFQRRNRRQKTLSLIAAIITLLLMFLLYNNEFSISVKDDTVLSTAIDEYFFTESVDAEIISIEKGENVLFVFFKRNGYEGHYGYAALERGIFGKYRFLEASLSDYPLYNCSYANHRCLGKEYVMIIGLYNLPNVASYEILPYGEHQNPLFESSVEQAPFMRIIKTNGKELDSFGENVTYYDVDGNKMDTRELKTALPVAADGACPSVGSPELEIIYIFLAIIFIVGIIFVLYYLFSGDEKEILLDGRSKNEQ